MNRVCILSWAFDTDYLDRYRIMEKQIVNYDIQYTVDRGSSNQFIDYDPSTADNAKVLPTYSTTVQGAPTRYTKDDLQSFIWTHESEAIVWANQLGEASAMEPAPIAYLGAFPGSLGVLDAMALTRDFLTDGMYGRLAMQGEPQVDRIPPR